MLKHPLQRHRPALAALALALPLAGCGGSASNPLDNPATVSNAATVGGQHLSYAYFQRCINPILIASLTIPGSSATNTCAGSGCHAAATGAGGALRIVPDAQPLSIADPAHSADVIRATDMYKNFYSAQGEVVIGSDTESRLLAKPLLLNVLHGGGQIFASIDDPNAKLIRYWITHPAPKDQDEFSRASDAMFTPADPDTGSCNTL